MTIDEVERLREGRDKLMYAKQHDRRTFPVTKVWVSKDRTMARVRIASLYGDDWIPLGNGADDPFVKYIPPTPAKR